jgi:hypothetical protein
MTLLSINFADATFWSEHWGDVASVLGVVLTIGVLFRTKSIAAAVRDAARTAKSRLLSVDSMADCAAAISMMEEIKRLHRNEAWSILPDRYMAVRRALNAIHANAPRLQPAQESMLTAAIAQFAIIEKKVERAGYAQNHDVLSPANLNSVVSKQIDEIDRLRNLIRKAEN